MLRLQVYFDWRRFINQVYLGVKDGFEKFSVKNSGRFILGKIGSASITEDNTNDGYVSLDKTGCSRFRREQRIQVS